MRQKGFLQICQSKVTAAPLGVSGEGHLEGETYP